MMNKYFLIIILITSSCIDPIDFEVPAGLSDSVVIQGRLVLGTPSYVEIGVSRLFDFSPESRQPVSVRRVVLYDDNNNEMVLETNVPGQYYQVLDNTTPIQANVGQGYRITVETFDNRVFESSSDIMPANLKPEDLDVSITQENVPDLLGTLVPQDRLQLSLDTQVDNNTDGGVYWEVNTVYRVTDSGINTGDVKVCYINKTADVNEIYVIDPGSLTGGKIENYNLGVFPIDFRAAEGLYFEVRQYSLSREAYRYWNGINILSEREGNMFDGPVGEIATNFENTNDPDDSIFGYFFATQEQLVRTKVDPALVGNVRSLCPSASPCFSGPGGNCICGLCCDCLIDPSATTRRPAFWID